MASPDEMDAAAQRAAADLDRLRAEQPEAVNLLVAWWQQHYRAAGHKRLGRVLVSLSPKTGAGAASGPGGSDDA